MNKVILTLILVSFLFFNCGNSTNEKANNQLDTVKQFEHQHYDEKKAIELNNGEKWRVDANMLTHIRNMENDVSSFAKDDQKYYKALAEKLQSNIDLLTSNCTMKGKAHDELHKWLLPYIDRVDALAIANNDVEASKQFENILSLFSTFNQHFQ